MYNYSYAAEKAWDNLYDRNEDAEVRYCPECSGEGLIWFSNCCGADIEVKGTFEQECTDCKKPCVTAHEKCNVCKGEGVL